MLLCGLKKSPEGLVSRITTDFPTQKSPIINPK